MSIAAMEEVKKEKAPLPKMQLWPSTEAEEIQQCKHADKCYNLGLPHSAVISSVNAPWNKETVGWVDTLLEKKKDKKEKDKKQKDKKPRFPLADYVGSKKEEDKEKKDEARSSHITRPRQEGQTRIRSRSEEQLREKNKPMSPPEAARHEAARQEIRNLCDSIKEAELADKAKRQKAWLESLEERGFVMTVPQAMQRGLLPKDFQPKWQP